MFVREVSVLTLLLAVASADTLDVTLEVFGETATWVVEDAEEGQVLVSTVDVRGGYVELVLDYMPRADEVELRAVITEVQERRWREDRRTVLSRPTLLTRPGVPATISMGTGVPIPGTDPVEFEFFDGVTLEVVPERGSDR